MTKSYRDTVPWYEMPHGIEREIAKYDQCEEPGDCDHDHDNAIEYFREQELNGLRAERDQARAELETLRARLEEIGEVREEWNVGSDDGEPNYIRTLSEVEARRIAGWDALAPLRRFVGEWRKAEQRGDQPVAFECWCGCQGNPEDHDLAGR